MKNLLSFLFVLCFASVSFAQTCDRDSSLLQSGKILSPYYWDSLTMEYNLNDACINQPYNQSVTVLVPSEYQGLQIEYVTIATTGAITDLPAGLTYSCDPPNCVFNVNQLGCIRLYGTPTTANMAPDTFDLGIKTKIKTTAFIFLIDFEFPKQLPGNSNHYYLALKTEECLVGTYDHNSSLGYVKSAPNPFSNETTITIESIVPGNFQFEVFDIFGQRVHQRALRLDAGINEFTFDGGNLANGSYFYTIGNRDGKVSRRIVIAR